jgi:hypothetical protein
VNGITTLGLSSATLTAIYAADGTASAPPYRFWSTNSGMYHPGSDGLAFATNSVRRGGWNSAGAFDLTGAATFSSTLAVTGSVGFGTSGSTGCRLDIRGTGNTSSTYGLVVVDYATTHNNFWVRDDGVIYVRAGGTFDAGITVNGYSYFTVTQNSVWALAVSNSGSTSAHGLYVNIGASSTGIPFRVDINGSQKFAVNNDGSVTVNGTLTESSSITLKENINPITNALSLIGNITGYTYDRKDGTAKNQSGFLAEEIANIIPSVVSFDEAGNPTGVQYTKIIAYLVESIKELKAELDIIKRV